MISAPVKGAKQADAVLLTWFSHRRTTSIGRELDIPVIEIATSLRHVFRYATLSIRTIALLIARRPRALIAQSPSLVLVLLLIALRPLFRYRLIVDAHNESIVPYKNTSAFVLYVTHFCIRHADLTIVTNDELSALVRAAGGRPFVLPDPLPKPPTSIPAPTSPQPYLVVVCTYAPDEPLREIFSGAAQIPHIHVHVTGNHGKLARNLLALKPPNVHLTGYLSDGAYWSLLAYSSGIVDLTTMPNCLVCGAYEAMALGVPMVLTDNAPTRRLFGNVAVLVTNNAEDICRGLQSLTQPPAGLSTLEEAHRYMATWRQTASRLQDYLQSSPR